MKVFLSNTSTEPEDGIDQSVIISQDGIETVEDMLYVFQQFIRASGFDYIDVVHAKSEDGQTWSSSL